MWVVLCWDLGEYFNKCNILYTWHSVKSKQSPDWKDNTSSPIDLTDLAGSQSTRKWPTQTQERTCKLHTKRLLSDQCIWTQILLAVGRNANHYKIVLPCRNILIPILDIMPWEEIKLCPLKSRCIVEIILSLICKTVAQQQLHHHGAVSFVYTRDQEIRRAVRGYRGEKTADTSGEKGKHLGLVQCV